MKKNGQTTLLETKMAREFLHDYMPVVRILSDKSVGAYKQSLNSYLTFLKETKNLEKDGITFDAFSRDNVKEYIVSLKTRDYSPKSMHPKFPK